MVTPKFGPKASSFHSELTKRINEYFKSNNISQTGNFKLYSKAIILLTSLVLVYTHLVFFTPHWTIAIVDIMLLSLITASIGFNVMHDGAHGSFSKSTRLNNLAGLTLNLLGANVFLWKLKHNVIHHTFTNVDGVDDDIDAAPFMRFCNSQERRWYHRFQHLYFMGAYSLLYLAWMFYTDYKKYFRGKIGEYPIKNMKTSDHVSFWVWKSIHLMFFVIIPILSIGFIPTLIGFIMYGMFTGIVLSAVFQLAHVLEEAQFPQADSANKLEEEWAVHQLLTTANFATRNKVVSWFVGGLNFQVEHHLFPKISHIHYPEVSKIVKSTCQEFGVPYIEYPTVSKAFASHYNHLKTLGSGDIVYDSVMQEMEVEATA